MTVGIGIVGLGSNEFAKIKNGKELLAESVHRILNTAPGERPYDPNFGCDLKRLLFENDLFYVSRSAQYMIQTALNMYEPRLEILAMEPEILSELKKVRIKLMLREKSTQEIFTTTSTIQLSE